MLVGIDERNYEFRRFFNADHPYYALNIPSSPVISTDDEATFSR